MLSKFFNWAEQHGLRADGTNPCRHIEKYRERKRERFLTEDEFERLGRALADAEREMVTTPWIIAAIRLLILTGARLSEIRTLRWTEVDVERRMLRLGDSKTGEKTIHLSDAALEVLARIPRLPTTRTSSAATNQGRASSTCKSLGVAYDGWPGSTMCASTTCATASRRLPPRKVCRCR